MSILWVNLCYALEMSGSVKKKRKKQGTEAGVTRMDRSPWLCFCMPVSSMNALHRNIQENIMQRSSFVIRRTATPLVGTMLRRLFFFAAIKIIIKKVILLRAQHNSVLTKSAFGVRDWKALTAEKLQRHADNKFWTTLPALPTTEPVHWAARLDVSRHIILTLCHPETKMELGTWRARHHRGFWFISRTPWLCFSRCSVGDCVGWK